MTVRNTLITVTIRVPSFLLSLSDIRLDTIVPPDMAMDTMPIDDIGTPSSRCMTGQPGAEEANRAARG